MCLPVTPHLSQVLPCECGCWPVGCGHESQAVQLSTQAGLSLRVCGQQEQRPADGVGSGLQARTNT
jgi:hypothetical protein